MGMPLRSVFLLGELMCALVNRLCHTSRIESDGQSKCLKYIVVLIGQWLETTNLSRLPL